MECWGSWVVAMLPGFLVVFLFLFQQVRKHKFGLMYLAIYFPSHLCS